uniref:Uncharacterized protein n=1 Tax=Caenorhabditis japonica TaxID=281687 RepID=A0A8R1ERL2_CAEJA
MYVFSFSVLLPLLLIIMPMLPPVTNALKRSETGETGEQEEVNRRMHDRLRSIETPPCATAPHLQDWR